MVYAGAIHRGVDDPRRGVEVLFRRCRSDAIESRQTQAAPVGHPVNYPPPHCAHTILQKRKEKNPCPRIPLQVDPTRSKWGLQGSLKDPIKILENLRRISPLNVFNYSTNKQTNKQIPQELSIIHGLIHESV